MYLKLSDDRLLVAAYLKFEESLFRSYAIKPKLRLADFVKFIF
jgi:hypothetical protein